MGPLLYVGPGVGIACPSLLSVLAQGKWVLPCLGHLVLLAVFLSASLADGFRGPTQRRGEDR